MTFVGALALANRTGRFHVPDLSSAECAMNERESFSDLIYDEQTHLAVRELSAFVSAANELYGSERATLSAEDWLDESELMDSRPRSELRNWRAVTFAASARLANQVDASAASG